MLVNGIRRGYQTFLYVDDITKAVSKGSDRDSTDMAGWEEQVSRGYENYYTVPAWWASAILSEKYWREIIPSLGTEALRAPAVTINRTNFDTGTVEVAEPSFPIVVQSRPLQDIEESPEFNSGTPRGVAAKKYLTELDAVVEKIEARRRDINHDFLARTGGTSWYPWERQKWSILPWGNTRERHYIEEFRYHHTARNYWECRRITRACEDEITELLANAGTNTEHNLKLPFGVIALLMHASSMSHLFLVYHVVLVQKADMFY